MKIPDAKTFTLGNGVRVATEAIPSLRSACIGIFVGVGSSWEDDTNRGISHLIEHMTFKGTKNRSALEIAQEIDGVGGKMNAFTSKEGTMYYCIVPDRHLTKAMDILTDIYHNSLYDPKELELEKKVILEEIRMYEDTPDEQIHDLFASVMLKGHGLGASTLGTEKSVNAIRRESIESFRKRFYAPGNLIVSVAGNIDPEQCFKYIEGSFSSLPSGGETVSEPLPQISRNIKLKKKKTEQVHLVIGTKGLSQLDERRYAFAVLDNALGGSMSSRLFQEVREKRGLAYSIYSFNHPFKSTGIFEVYAGTKKENLGPVTDIILGELRKVRDEGISELEIERSKEYIKGGLVLSLESSNSRMNFMTRSLFYHDRIVTIDEMMESVDAVTSEKIIGLARELFTDVSLNVAVIGDIGRLPEDKLKL